MADQCTKSEMLHPDSEPQPRRIKIAAEWVGMVVLGGAGVYLFSKGVNVITDINTVDPPSHEVDPFWPTVGGAIGGALSGVIIQAARYGTDILPRARRRADR